MYPSWTRTAQWAVAAAAASAAVAAVTAAAAPWSRGDAPGSAGNPVFPTEITMQASFPSLQQLFLDTEEVDTASVAGEGRVLVEAASSRTQTFEVGRGRLDVSARWADGDVVLALVAPSGRIIDRSTDAPDVTHEVGPTFESYHVTSPEQGTWTASLRGARVAAAGTDVRLTVAQPDQPQPLGRELSVEQQLTGDTLTVHAVGPDMEQYLWEFGDGAIARAKSAQHTYTDAGSYLVSLAARDHRGRWHVTAAPEAIEVR